MLELAPRVWAAQERLREDEQAGTVLLGLEADQRLLVALLDKARASAPPQGPPEPEDTQDRQEIPELEVEKIDFNGSVSQLVLK